MPKTAQAWVRNTSLAATVVIPPLAGQALDMLVTAIRTGAVPPEVTQVAPHSFPALDALETAHSVRVRAATHKI